MKVVKVLAAVLMAGFLSSHATAQPTAGATYLSSPNLIPSVSGTWTGTVPGEAGGISGGGTGPAFNESTNTIIFGYTQKTAAYTYAFNQALQSAGLAIGGYDYSWKINNSDTNSGTLSGKFTLTAINGTPLQTYNYSYNDSTGAKDNFITYSGTQWFPQNHSSSNISGFTMEWTGKDNRFWAGYYGPRVREPSIQLRYLVDQCATNPLSSPECPGYAAAYQTQQCTANPLYNPSCPGYAAAYQTQQCTVNALSDPSCPGYTTAYATKMVLEQQGIAGTVATAGEIAKKDPTQVSSDGTLSTTGNTIVDKALPPPATTANSAVAPAAPVQLVQQPRMETGQQGQPQQDRKQEGVRQEGPAGQQGQPQNERPQQSTTRTALAERRVETARKEAIEKGKNLASEVGRAENLEKQKEIQNVVIAAMGYNPGFESYGKTIIPDVAGYKPFTVYNNQKTIDNRSSLRMFGGSEQLHNEMVESQYKQWQKE